MRRSSQSLPKGRSDLPMWQHPLLYQDLWSDPGRRLNPRECSWCPQLMKAYLETQSHKGNCLREALATVYSRATKFKKLQEPKLAKFNGGYSSNASLVFQLWLKDIWVYTLECHLSQWEAIQLVKDYTSEQTRSEVEYYLGLTPKDEQSFQD